MAEAGLTGNAGAVLRRYKLLNACFQPDTNTAPGLSPNPAHRFFLIVNPGFSILAFGVFVEQLYHAFQWFNYRNDFMGIWFRIQWMNEPNFNERYSRQIRLPKIGEQGQRKLMESRIFIVGMGGLGSPVALYLAAAGVGHMIIADFDQVDESNLQRQIIHTQNDIGGLKAESAANSLRQINPGIQIETLDYSLDNEDFTEHCANIDLLIDCTDNFPTRFELNEVSLKSRIPFVSGAAIRWEGQVTAFDPRNESSPCYQCLYPNKSIESATCEMEGVVAPLVGIIGTMQAMEAVNILIGEGQLHGIVWLFDAQSMEWQKMILPKNPHCPACGQP